MTNSVFSDRNKKGRGRSRRSLDLIQAMYEVAEESRPITGRGVGYKLFSLNLIPSMGRNDMQGVWHWIVDETRTLEQVPTWDDADAYMQTMIRDYRRDFWRQQPRRVELWSEKGTIRGVLQPVLDDYAVGFRVMHGFGSATAINDVAQTDSDYPLTILYIGDYDPSGLYMSEHDIPDRLARYGGDHITIRRIALLRNDCDSLGRKPAFNVKEKSNDTRAPWYRKNYGQLCWELDALDPNKLRARVEREIKKQIEPIAWKRCQTVFEAETESMTGFLETWKHWS